MFREKKLFSRFRDANIGPGGWHCPCCAPPVRARKQYIRKVKRGAFKNFVKKMVEYALS